MIIMPDGKRIDTKWCLGSGRDIYLSHDPLLYMNKNDFYAKEIGCLLEHGFIFEKIGDIWHVVR